MKLIRKTKRDNGSNQAIDSNQLSPWKILVIDDEPDIHAITRLSLRNFQFAGKSLCFLQAMSAQQARELLAVETDIAVAFVDVVMETDDAGLRLVEFIRNDLNNDLMRLIIRTGQPGVAPEKIVVDRYDIDDYKEKTELTSQKLYTTLRSALKAYRDLTRLNNNHQGLEKILAAATELYSPQLLSDFFSNVLRQMINLCTQNENHSTTNDGLVITFAAEKATIQAGAGRFAEFTNNPEAQQIAQLCVDHFINKQQSDVLSFIPLYIQDELLGLICLENLPVLEQAEQQLIHVMANQSVSALKNLQLFTDLKEANRQALYMLAVAAEHKDQDTGDHINRIAHYAEILVAALGFSKPEVENIALASMLHDIGKLGIPDSILQKPGKLTQEEFEIIKMHPKIGAEILEKNKWFITAYHIAYNHHEKWDGSGYPRGLKAEEIPISARIVAILDVFDALTHKRCYKEAWSTECAIAALKEGAGTHFDPHLVELFIEMYQQGKFVT